jgi:hypothetical protein
MDAFTQSLITNPRVIAVDQHSVDNKSVVQTGDSVVWTASSVSGKQRFVAVFNLGDAQRTISYSWQDLGLNPGRYHLRDLWSGRDLGRESSLKLNLEPHASVLYEAVQE